MSAVIACDRRPPAWRLTITAGLLLAAHLGTALIQADPRRAAAWLDAVAAGWPVDPVWPILALAGWLAWWLALGTRPQTTLTAAWRQLREVWGPVPAGLAIAALLLPQRVLDNNSGYTLIDRDSALFLVCLVLDVIRGLGAFAVFHGVFCGEGTGAAPARGDPAGTPGPAGATSEKPACRQGGRGEPPASPIARGPCPPGDVASPDGDGPPPEGAKTVSPCAFSPREERPGAAGAGTTRTRPDPWLRPWLVTVAVTLLAAAAVALQFGPLEGIPHVDDEIIQDWHARLLAAGRVRGTAHGCLESFAPDSKIGSNGEHLFSTYQPGLALVWSVFQPWGAVGLVNPALGVLAVLLFLGLLRRTHGVAIARLAAVLLAGSPFLVLMAAGRMNHLLALVLVLAAARGLFLLASGAPVTGGVATGLAVGLCLLTRRVEAAALLGGVVLAVLTWPGFDRRQVVFLAVVGLLVGGVFTLQAALFRAHTGNPRQSLDHAQGVLASWGSVPPVVLWQNLVDNVLGFGAFAFGGVVAGWWGFAFLRWRGKGAAGLLERFFLVQAGLTLLVYGAYEYQDFCYGPRYLFGLLPAAALGTTLGLAALAARGGEGAVRRWLGIGLAFSLLLTCHQGWGCLSRKFWNIDGRFERFVRETVRSPALLFLRSPTRVRVQAARMLAARGLSRELVVAATQADALDVDGLVAAVASEPEPARVPGVVTAFLAAAAGRDPVSFDISPWEAVRLNTDDPLRQDIVIALDLGDEPNEALRRALPGHTAWLAGCRFGEPFLRPYEPAAVPRF
ncbi:MAG: hypothetical protein GX442_18470 [Candidatus Riflebacteria bacterium]|nr:hypothetical protein [Candidatus Riflebacteria bacterium]